MVRVTREVSRILDAAGKPLSERVVRYSAFDAQREPQPSLEGIVEPFYTLNDQLFVEPQPLAIPDVFDLTRPIKMSDAEVAVALSHIGVWRAVAQSSEPYSLILEDDVTIERNFARAIDDAWREIKEFHRIGSAFDVLYVSYKEARYGAPKELLSPNLFRPERGLWYLSGYFLSNNGARKLLGLLPCRGPIDLWINHKFGDVNVLALRKPVVNQRLDTVSTNSYSILPMLTRIGVLDCGNALFHQRPSHVPVFAFGEPGSGLSSLALALSMLGYRCCSDLDDIPQCESEELLSGSQGRIFNAYVNIGSLKPRARTLAARYPQAKFIVTGKLEATDELLDYLQGADVIHLSAEADRSWVRLCEHLRLPPPATPYPDVKDVGQRKYQRTFRRVIPGSLVSRLRHDPSPWVAEVHKGWKGITATRSEQDSRLRVTFKDNLTDAEPGRWFSRNDTFPGNLGLFRPTNVIPRTGGGLSLTVRQQALGVRTFSAASISSRETFLYGRFEGILQPARVSGVVTGFFLHRDSPRQEIDVEITGNRPDRLLVNVFFNPGTEGAKFDYGNRGTPVAIPLGFDASAAPHRFAIEWEPCEIRWFVDGELVHWRSEWNPTPIPNLPMTLHVNAWPTRSRELAGRLAVRSLPASAAVQSIAVDAFDAAMLTSCQTTDVTSITNVVGGG